MSDAFTRLQGLLRQLFQFVSADLDFGVYRIMNHRGNGVERNPCPAPGVLYDAVRP